MVEYKIVFFGWDEYRLRSRLLIQKKDKSSRNSSTIVFTIYWKKFNHGNIKSLRIDEIRLIEKHQEGDFYSPEKMLKILKTASVILTEKIPSQELNNRFLAFIKDYRIKKPLLAELCYKCLENKKITILNNTKKIIHYEKHLCQSCAVTELQEELQLRGIHLKKEMINRFFKSGEQVISTRDLLKHYVESFSDLKRDNTLFDVIPGEVDENALPIEKIDLPNKFKQIFINDGITKLFGPQRLALENGLLQGESLLVVAGTSSGKTLVGEMAGIKAIMSGKKFIYLTPLVALANQKFEEFKKKYGEYKVALRVGVTQIKTEWKKQDIKDLGDLKNSRVLVATYEAFDYLLRSRQFSKNDQVGVVVIDEIQMLNDEERGPLIDGMIARLKSRFGKKTQLIALSATVGNPRELASLLDLKLVFYNKRPVPLERHLVLLPSMIDKARVVEEKLKEFFSLQKNRRVPSQAIIFTNSRVNCQELAFYLSNKGFKSAYYHAGLTYYQRKKIERDFLTGKINVVVATFALGAGVDFPANIVIFETLLNGNRPLTTTEFEQMSGRAGRLRYNERGFVLILANQGKKLPGKDSLSEDELALHLLTAPVEDVIPSMNDEQEQEQVLAGIAMFKKMTFEQLKTYYRHLLGRNNQLKTLVLALSKKKMIEIKNKTTRITDLGWATSVSFLSPDKAQFIVRSFEKHDPIQDILASMDPFNRAFLDKWIFKEIEKKLKFRFSANVFRGDIFELLSERGDLAASISKKVLNALGHLMTTLYPCNHDTAPYCGCGEKELSKILIEKRMNSYKISKIINEIKQELFLVIYPGDLIEWYDQLIHHLEGIIRLSKTLGNYEIAQKAKNLIKNIQDPIGIKK